MDSRPIITPDIFEILFPHQIKVFNDVINLRRENRDARTIFVTCPTGFGKTEVGAAWIAFILRGNPRARIIFVVPDISLIDQVRDRLVSRGVAGVGDISVMQADHPDYRPTANLIVATAQTLEARGWPEGLDVVFVDEAHVARQATYKFMASEAAASTVFLGLSATPQRKGLGNHWKHLVRGPTIVELQRTYDDNGRPFLVPTRVKAPPTAQPDLKGVRTASSGDFNEGDLEERCARPQLVADIVSTWIELAENRPTLVFASRKAHAEMLRDQFLECHVPAGLIIAETERTERLALFAKLRSGEIKVIVNVACLTRGFDLPAVSCIVLARPTKSVSMFMQIVGRGLRPADGKTDCLILDHARVHETIGSFVEDIEIDELDTGADGAGDAKRKKKDLDRAKQPKCCDSCHELSPSHVRECIHCGTKFPLRTVVEVVDGKLVDLTRDGMKAKKGDPTPVGDRLREMGPDSVHGQLEWVRRERGRKSGWVFHSYKKIFGKGPHNRINRDRVDRPTTELMGWIRAADIAFAKARGSYSSGAPHAN
jgi:DNA repair protein RadD